MLAKSCCPNADLKHDPLGEQTGRLIDLTQLIAVVALIVGWQATSGVLIVTSLLAWLLGRMYENPMDAAVRADVLGRFAVSLPVVLTLQIVFWRPLSQSGWWPSEQATPHVLMAYGLATILIPLWLRDPLRLAGRVAEHETTPGTEQ